MNLGKRAFKSTAPNIVKTIILVVLGLAFINLYISTFRDEKFIQLSTKAPLSVWEFYLSYPEDFISFLVVIFIPAIYYSFIRGIVFYEKGISINRGLPFFNRELLFEQIESYKVVHPKYLISITRKDPQDELLFSVRNMDRVIGFLDGHLVRVEALDETKEAAVSGAQKKLVMIIIGFSIALLTLQQIGVFRSWR